LNQSLAGANVTTPVAPSGMPNHAAAPSISERLVDQFASRIGGLHWGAFRIGFRES